MRSVKIMDRLCIAVKASLVSVATIFMLLMEVQTACAKSEKTAKPDVTFHFSREKTLNHALCKVNDIEFQMVLTSPSGEATEDDITLWFLQSGEAIAANREKPGYIAFLPVASNIASVCEAAAAFPLPRGCIAVPLFLSNRPDLDLLAIAVYDPQKKKVLTYAVLERYFGETPAIRPIKDGFSFMAVTAQPNDGPKGSVESWMNITWDGKKVVKKRLHSGR